jgi:hypothetical protein
LEVMGYCLPTATMNRAKWGCTMQRRNSLAKTVSLSGILALKPMARQQWPKGKRRRWKKAFYEPFDEIDKAALGLRFTLHLPVPVLLGAVRTVD